MRNHTHTMRAAAALLVGAGTAALLTGCTASSADTASCEGDSVEVGITGSLSDALLYIANDKGYFAEEGLDVTMRSFKSASQMIPYMAAGHLAVGAGAPSAGFYNGLARNIDVKIVADKGGLARGYNYMPMLVRKDLYDSGEITSVADLAGHSVAEPAPGTTTASTISSLLEADGLSYDDIEHVFIGFPDHLAALENGSVDASVTTEPTATRALEGGKVVKLADSTDVYNDQQLSVLLYSGDFVTKDPATAQCFMNAYTRAVSDLTTVTAGQDWNGPGGEEIVKIISDSTSAPPELVTSTVPAYVKDDASLNVESLKRDYQFFVDSGLYQGTKEIDFDSLVDTSFIENAAKTAAEG